MSGFVCTHLKVRGKLHLVLTDSDGKIKAETLVNNLVVDVGLNYLASAVIANATSPMLAVAIGSGTTAAAAGNTTLETELARVAFTSSSTTANVSTTSTTFGPGVGTGTITEAGMFSNATAGGNMLCRTVFTAIPKAASDTLTATWNVTTSAV